MSIYTRTGDLGETSLFGGKRVLKCDDQIDIYGLIDELNSFLGLVRSTVSIVDVQEFLQTIQKDLFSISSILAGGLDQDMSYLSEQVSKMESRIDMMEKKLEPIHKFILPGGTTCASYVHIARSVARRVERKAVYILKQHTKYPEVNKKQLETSIQYLNRLSDFLFVLARYINKEENMKEILWDRNKE